MKQLVAAVAMFAVAASAFADQYVRPHIRNDGTYVEGHYRSTPNNTAYDNYSARGNSNPYTGQRGYDNPAPTPRYEAPTIQPYANPYDTGAGQRRSRSGW